VSVYNFVCLDTRGRIFMEKEGNVLQWSYTGVKKRLSAVLHVGKTHPGTTKRSRDPKKA